MHRIQEPMAPHEVGPWSQRGCTLMPTTIGLWLGQQAYHDDGILLDAEYLPWQVAGHLAAVLLGQSQ